MEQDAQKILEELEASLETATLDRIEQTVDLIADAKQNHKKVVVVTGSGPNVHEGVTTLIAELMRAGVVDGVATSSAVAAHEMGGALDQVKRCQGDSVGVDPFYLPYGGEFELTEVDDDLLQSIEEYMPVDHELIHRLQQAEGKTIIKAAGNLGYPAGLWLERASMEIAALARSHGMSFEEVAGLGADERTMLGIGAKKGLPVIVTIPQLIGGGLTGLCIGESIGVIERANRLAHMLDSAEVIIESGVVLTQEIHDGPLERYTGHGLWSAWLGHFTYSLEGKKLVRIDLDPNLEQAWQIERKNSSVQLAIADGRPKTKMFDIPFRMEMSGFARHPNSLPIIGDLGLIWPAIARRLAKRLDLRLEFISFPQQSDAGQAMREWIVREIKPLNWKKLLEKLRALS
ncbi:MAG: hypothetical protein JXR73_12535 [Candidatus Omnitrophica bacterium]|nr:hypothetical protein [Candidatus Omnitrophota bacterium]